MLIHQHMVPTTVVINDELPKTSTGKIQKFLLRVIDKGIALPSLFFLQRWRREQQIGCKRN